MKQLLTFLLSIIFIAPLNSQCPNETIVLLTQTDVDNFAQQYPDCTHLETNLYLGTDTFYLSSPICESTSDPILDLNGLNQLTYIRDSLVIQCNNSLQIIDGFNGLDSVGSIFISNNEELTNILGFSNINKITQILRVWENHKINTIEGFNSLKTARSITITENALVDLSKLEYCFALSLRGNIEMVHMDSILTLLNLSINGNNVLYNFDFLSGSELDIPTFQIRLVPQLFSFRGLELLKRTDLRISDVYDVDFSQLESLSEMNVFRLSNCEKCTTLNGLNSLVGEIGIIRIKECENIENIDALSGIASISTLLEISNNANLNNCSIKPICRALSNDVIVLNIENNGSSNTCNTSDQVLMSCTDKETYLDYTICDGDTISLNNVDYTSVGLFYQDFINQQGLDSILVINIVASDDCSDPNDNPDLCPLDEEKPGLQINKLSNDLYDIIITYKDSNMSLEDIGYDEIVEIIACHKVCKDLTFDASTFSFLDHCDMMDDLSRGAHFDVPTNTKYDALKYYTSIEEIRYFSEFIVRMTIEECVKM